GLISGSGSLTKARIGTLTLANGNNYTGSTTINGGILKIADDTALGTAPGAATPGQLTLGGGTLETTASFTLNANRGIALNANGILSVDPGTTLTYNGIIAGGNSLTKSDTGTLILGGANSYSGATSVNAGSLSLTNANAVNNTSSISIASSALLDLNFNNATF